MSEKTQSRLKEGLINLFGKESWIVTHWLTSQVDLNAEFLQFQDRTLLTKLLDSFPGKQNLTNPDFLRLLNDWSGVELRGQVPEIHGTAYAIGNYVGVEPTLDRPPYLDPTIWGLVKLFEVANNAQLDQVLAVARETAFDGMDARLKNALSSQIAFAKKETDGDYTLPYKEKAKLLKTVRAPRSLLWTAPAATTVMDGLKFDHLTTTSVRQAMERDRGQLLTVSMVTTPDKEKTIAIELDEVLLPSVEVPKTLGLKSSQQAEILREINYQILLWAYAQTASHLPKGQRGQFEDFDQAKRRVMWTLKGMQNDGLVKIDGGFIMNL